VITAQIPAAIRACSPVALVDPLDTAQHLSGRRGTVHARNGNLCSFAIDGVESVVIAGVDSLALIISDPTGAAHLAWWLRRSIAKISAAQNSEHIAAIGATVDGFWDIILRAEHGAVIYERSLCVLRDYALRVVSNG